MIILGFFGIILFLVYNLTAMGLIIGGYFGIESHDGSGYAVLAILGGIFMCVLEYQIYVWCQPWLIAHGMMP